ncbi:hypothetical protein chiPu_0001855, partial [Chiloscyllium punctatum]|nr:hypothetical protein [Chiloscyllium punctatum]
CTHSLPFLGLRNWTLLVAALLPLLTAAPAESPAGRERRGLAERRRMVTRRGRAAEQRSRRRFSSIPDFAHQALHPITIWQGKHFALDKSELAHQTQDRFSGKDSGKGDSDFNDSDSDISGVGLSKRSALSQKHNGLWSCTNECKILGHSDRCWSPSSRGPSIYRSTTTTQHLTSLGKSTSLPRDLLRKDTYYQALLPKTAGLQSVYQKITCDESETTNSVIVPLYHSVGSKSHIPPTNISSINVSSVHSQI